MRTRTSPSRGVAAGRAGGLAAVAAVFLIVIGAVMGESHVPVAIEPDADRGAGVEVATFALG
jgi:hypothetical protein